MMIFIKNIRWNWKKIVLFTKCPLSRWPPGCWYSNPILFYIFIKNNVFSTHVQEIGKIKYQIWKLWNIE